MLIASSAASAQSLLSVGSTQGLPGDTVNVTINFTGNSTTSPTNITGMNFDLLFNTNYLQAGTPTVGDAIPNPFFGFNLIAPGDMRVLSLAFPTAPASNGVVAFIPFTIAPNAPGHDEPLVLTNIAATDANGIQEVLSPSNGVLSIIGPPLITQIIPTNGGAIHLVLSGRPTRNYFIQAATNLAAPQWQPFTNLVSGSNGVFEDVTATNFPTRFYRAQLAP